MEKNTDARCPGLASVGQDSRVVQLGDKEDEEVEGHSMEDENV